MPSNSEPLAKRQKIDIDQEITATRSGCEKLRDLLREVKDLKSSDSKANEREKLNDVANRTLTILTQVKRSHANIREDFLRDRRTMEHLTTGNNQLAKSSDDNSEKEPTPSYSAIQTVTESNTFEKSQYVQLLVDCLGKLQQKTKSGKTNMLERQLIPDAAWKTRTGLLEKGLEPGSALYRLHHMHFELKERERLEGEVRKKRKEKTVASQQMNEMKKKGSDNLKMLDKVQEDLAPVIKRYEGAQ